MPSTSTISPKLRIAIIGAGISGLSAALFLRKHPQCSVTIYERRDADFKEPSAALGLWASGISVAKQLGISREDLRAVVGHGIRYYNLKEEEISKKDLDIGPDGDGGMWNMYRQDFKDVLLRKIMSEEGQENPIKLLYGIHVVGVDPEIGVVKFADGTSVQTDLIIGADGIHSKVRPDVIPASHPEPIPCGYSMFRFVLPMEVVKDAIGSEEQMPAMFDYNEGVYIAILSAGPGDSHTIMYPCRGHELMNFACAVPDSKLKDSTYSWNAVGSVEEMVEIFRGFPEWLVRILCHVHQVGLFQLRDQEPLPTYVSGRAVLIGDAAHAMVPYQAQGANQALEDSEGLNVLFRNVSDRESVPGLLRLWDCVRRPRASEVQRGSRASLAGLASRAAADRVVSVKPFVGMKKELAQMPVQQNDGILT